MDLKRFVSETLTQVFEGVADAQEKAGSDGRICPVIRKDSIRDSTQIPALTDDGQPVEYLGFEVSVKVDDSNEVGGKLGISIATFSIGGEGKTIASEGAVSKISFRIPVVLPTGKIT